MYVCKSIPFNPQKQKLSKKAPPTQSREGEIMDLCGACCPTSLVDFMEIAITKKVEMIAMHALGNIPSIICTHNTPDVYRVSETGTEVFV
jgi:hypothetical protein